jgi:hypothetical protein
MNYLFFIYNLSLYYISFGLSVFIEKKIQKHFIKKAKKKIRSINPLIIGITGSYGKTSCKKYIYELLKTKYKTLSTPESTNSSNQDSNSFSFLIVVPFKSNCVYSSRTIGRDEYNCICLFRYL